MILVSLLGFSVSTAWGYVPPSFHIVRTIAKKHAQIEDVRLKSRVTVYSRSGDPKLSFTENLLLSGGRVAISISDDKEKRVASFSRRLAGNKPSDSDRPALYDLTVVHDQASLYEHLRVLGLPIRAEEELYAEKEGSLPYKPEEKVGLSRLENRVAVFVGENDQKEGVQPGRAISLWVEKDSLLPLRAVLPTPPESGASSEPLEFRFGNYQPRKTFMYPGVVQIWREGALWVKFETIQVASLAEGGEKLQLQGKSSIDANGDLKDFLENYYFRWIR